MSQFSDNLEAIFQKMENFVSTKTVVGEAITINDIVILPLIEVSVGVGAGSQNEEKNGKGVGGLGAKIVPSAVIVIQNGNVQLVNIKNQDAINKLIDMAPGVISKLNFGSFFQQKDEKKAKETDNPNHSEEHADFKEKTIVEP